MSSSSRTPPLRDPTVPSVGPVRPHRDPAALLEKALAQMTAEDAADCDDGRAKAVVGDMEPFEVESVVMGLLKAWMDDKLGLAKDCLLRARDTEVLPSSTARRAAGISLPILLPLANLQTCCVFFFF